jgi:hypothetical protein
MRDQYELVEEVGIISLGIVGTSLLKKDRRKPFARMIVTFCFLLYRAVDWPFAGTIAVASSCTSIPG